MADVRYKQYTEEEGRMYDSAISRIREGMKNGLSFQEACAAIEVGDAELRGLILDDALKIMIAEMHFGKGILLPQVAGLLKVPMDKISTAVAEMLDDVGATAAELYRQKNPDAPFGNA
ncbi:MAG: hypothetical protein K8I29_03400 [Alphaproteobacteria bacterium]|uniref:Uncharacterized protein n=1 Tax=Candidatus Nitrobium versatile TaxID=2884831 RepID=A0A953J472_9BACT|nr:hypothetical protein [Candidatus Nitrobium versatile]